MTNRTWIVAASLVAAAALGLTGCAVASGGTIVATASASSSADAGDLSPDAVLAANADATVVNDDEWSESDAVDVTLSGSTASSSSDGVAVDGATITITAAGVYRLTGRLDGQVVVDAPEDALVVLILDGVTISSSTTAAIAVVSADDVAVHLADGTTNTLSDASSYADDAEVNAALFSTEDLTIGGDGALIVHGNGNDGIVSHDDLVILSGDITVTSADDALQGKDSLIVQGGTLDLTAGGDAMKSNQDSDATKGYVAIEGGDITIASGDDGIQAATDIVMQGGTATISAGSVPTTEQQTSKGLTAGQVVAIGGGTLTITKSYEGIEGFDIAIAGGQISITSSDDGLNGSTGGQSTTSTTAQGGMGGDMSDGGEQILITGGELTIDAEGDGLDSNGSATIAGGTVTIWGPTVNDNGALDTNGSLTVTGGTLIAAGSTGMAETPDTDSAQGWVAATVSGSAGSSIEVRDAAGTVLASFTAAKAFASIVYSSSTVQSGADYTFVVDGASTTATSEQAISGGMGGGFGGGAGGAGPSGGGPGGGMPGQQP